MSDPSWADDYRTPNYFDHYWYNERNPGLPPVEPRGGGRWGPLSDVFGFLRGEMRAGRTGFTEEEIRRMTPEQRQQLAVRLLAERGEEEEDALGPPLPPRDEERRFRGGVRIDKRYDDYSDDDEEPIDQAVPRRRGLRGPDWMLTKEAFEERLGQDRSRFSDRQGGRAERFNARQRERETRFSARVQKRKIRWDKVRRRLRMSVSEAFGGRYSAEGSGRLEVSESVFSPNTHKKLFKTIIGFSEDHMAAEKNEAMDWAKRKFGLNFMTASKRGNNKLVLKSKDDREVAVMSPFVIHPEIEMVGGHDDNDTLYAGGYIFEITALNGVDLGGRSSKFAKFAKCGSVLLYGDYYIEHNGESDCISAVHFASSKAALPDEDGNVTIALDLRDNYAKTPKTSKGQGKMIVERDGKTVTVSNSLKFKSN